MSLFRRTRWIGCLLFTVAVFVRPAVATTPAGETALEYVSDYFSFVGTDGASRVAFALDTNRGRDGDSLQAEHFGVLHVEREGWHPLRKMGAYPHPGGALTALPDSAAFTFAGTAETGGSLRSAVNDIELHYDPLVVRISHSHAGSLLRLRSGSAGLHWRGREFRGRVIHEWLHLRGSNRLARRESRLLRDFQGFYLLLGDGDFYLHHQDPGPMAALLGATDGFLVAPGSGSPEVPVRLDDAKVKVLERSWGLGVYRWPIRWRIGWEGGALLVQLSDWHRIASWGIGGFAMAIAEGEAQMDGRRVPYYGLVELIR